MAQPASEERLNNEQAARTKTAERSKSQQPAPQKQQEVATRAPGKVDEALAQLDSIVDKLAEALPRHIPVDRFKRVVLTAIQRNPDLLNADRRSLWNACMSAAQDGLLPDGREGALVIFRTNDKKKGQNGKWIDNWIDKVQWLVMIQGLRKKARNSGEIADWNVRAVYFKDTFDYQLGDEEHIHHKPFMDGDPGPVVYFYSIAKLRDEHGNITLSRDVMSKGRVDRIRAMSKAPDSPAWKHHFDEMGCKTVARHHSKVLPMSSDLDDLIRRDDGLYDFDGKAEGPALPAPPRPQRSDFLPAGKGEPALPPPTEREFDAQTGEVIEGKAETVEAGENQAAAEKPGQQTAKEPKTKGVKVDENPKADGRMVQASQRADAIMAEIGSTETLEQLQELAEKVEQDLMSIGEIAPKLEEEAREWLAQRIAQLDPEETAEDTPAVQRQIERLQEIDKAKEDPGAIAEANGFAARGDGPSPSKSLYSAPDEFRGDPELLARWKDGWRKHDLALAPKKGA